MLQKSQKNIVEKEMGKMTANMVMMRLYSMGVFHLETRLILTVRENG